MQRKHDGYVLLIVLIFLQLFTLLALQSIANLMLDRKQIRLVLQRVSQQNIALLVLRQLDHENPVRCRISTYPADTLMRQSLSWWMQYACHEKINGQDYYYFRELLTTDPEPYYRHSLRLGLVIVQDTITQNGERMMLRWLR